MWHLYVLAASGASVDFHRASVLMDRDLLRGTLRAMRCERDTTPRHDARYEWQWIWDYYCQRHREKYGEYFRPNVDPAWDSRGVPAPDRSPELVAQDAGSSCCTTYAKEDITVLRAGRVEDCIL